MKNAEKSKRLDCQLYNNQDPLLLKEHLKVQQYLHKYNLLLPDRTVKREKLLKKIFGRLPENICVEQPFACDFGYNIRIGRNFYSNYNLTVLDCNVVTIGDNCLIGPNVSIITVNHPEDRISRIHHLEYAKPVTIGHDVWIGCGAIINPGVTIGNNVIIGSGSVVTKDLPSDTMWAGCPARKVRDL